MSLSLFARKTAASCALAVAVSPLALAQTNFPSLGTEYTTGSLAHDQTAPRVSINGSGGYAVWQDVATDSDGLGISGLPLNSDLSSAFTPFRINQSGAGDQEKPQVALLPNGGAVFAWQGGKQGFQQVYVRFLSSSNTWLTSDMLAGSSAQGHRINPALAVLSGGQVVVVWGSHDQRGVGSMQDVYGQIFSANGEKIGTEFAINQFSAFHQRTPAVTALGTGGFAVGWISEQQRGTSPFSEGQLYTARSIPTPSVDVYARLYDANGSAVTPEFQVNSTNLNVCANPALATSADGSLLVLWSQKDTQVRNNGWDVFAARVMSGALPSVTAPARVNTQLFGDQFAPQVSSIGNDHLVIWTSLGQDGSMEGVFGQFLTSTGNPTGGEFRVNSATAGRQIHPAVAADGSARFLALWTTYTGIATGFDIHAQRYASANYVPQATTTNYLAPTFVRDAISDPPVIPRLPVPVPTPPTDTVVSNLFILAQGSYSGLFYEENGVTLASSGQMTAKTTASGGFSANLQMGKKKYSFSGSFDSQGQTSRTITRKGLSPLTVSLQLDPSGAGQIQGQVTDGTWTATLLADRQVFSKVNSAPYAGKYTVLIPPTSAMGSPAGSSYGTVTVDSSGKVKFAGSLADGSKLTQSAVVSQNGLWPLFSAAYSGQGLVIGWMQFAEEEQSDVSGRVAWIRPPTGKGYYAGGFTNEATATGARYPGSSSASAQQRADDETDVVFSGGGLNGSFTNIVKWSAGRATVVSGGSMSLSVNSSSGLFKGSAVNSDTGKALKFQGVILKKGNLGAGFFLNNTESGDVYLSPAP